jgi:hypothetical protein
MGTVLDMKRREKLKRSDNAQRRGLVEQVRTWIFDKGFGVGSKAVEEELKPQSWVPVRVS